MVHVCLQCHQTLLVNKHNLLRVFAWHLLHHPLLPQTIVFWTIKSKPQQHVLDIVVNSCLVLSLVLELSKNNMLSQRWHLHSISQPPSFFFLHVHAILHQLIGFPGTMYNSNGSPNGKL